MARYEIEDMRQEASPPEGQSNVNSRGNQGRVTEATTRYASVRRLESASSSEEGRVSLNCARWKEKGISDRTTGSLEAPLSSVGRWC